jgi:hypothetical protein
MDDKHRFHTDQTWLWVRAEHLAVIAIAVGLLALHLREVSWLRFAAAFVAIDLIGYVPGAIAFKRRGGGRISARYHHLYNMTHSYLTTGALVGLWALMQGSFEWAMLAIPIHLAGDRGLFGNTYKPVSLPFEPVSDAEPARSWPVAHGEPSP